ncbi:hypothetical protein NB037_12025 [Rathayibacter sp. ZW T2_19]|uniref:Uncharacterized protein n=1 Tax=Rathayibacter rubneri TaxID=2950106 RepID=A0A9X2DY02_9MICO|nr:hypothetical protein [Rathayibacter rubneri]MCM6763145.1 hypothetical protein [Rathayibacter rubneri]
MGEDEITEGRHDDQPKRSESGDRAVRSGRRDAARRPRILPAPTLETDRPTTIGLGDSFAGGFVSALVRGAAA